MVVCQWTLVLKLIENLNLSYKNFCKNVKSRDKISFIFTTYDSNFPAVGQTGLGSLIRGQ